MNGACYMPVYRRHIYPVGAAYTGEVYSKLGPTPTSGVGFPVFAPRRLLLDTSAPGTPSVFVASDAGDRVLWFPGADQRHYGRRVLAGRIYTLVGDGQVAAAGDTTTGDGGPAWQAKHPAAGGIARTSAGDMLVLDAGPHGLVRLVRFASGTIQTLPLTHGGQPLTVPGASDMCLAERAGANALYLADGPRKVVWRVPLPADLHDLAASAAATVEALPVLGNPDGPVPAEAPANVYAPALPVAHEKLRIGAPTALAVDAAGNLWVAEGEVGHLRLVEAAALTGNGSVTTPGGAFVTPPGASGAGDVLAGDARLAGFPGTIRPEERGQRRHARPSTAAPTSCAASGRAAARTDAYPSSSSSSCLALGFGLNLAGSPAPPRARGARPSRPPCPPDGPACCRPTPRSGRAAPVGRVVESSAMTCWAAGSTFASSCWRRKKSGHGARPVARVVGEVHALLVGLPLLVAVEAQAHQLRAGVGDDAARAVVAQDRREREGQPQLARHAMQDVATQHVLALVAQDARDLVRRLRGGDQRARDQHLAARHGEGVLLRVPDGVDVEVVGLVRRQRLHQAAEVLSTAPSTTGSWMKRPFAPSIWALLKFASHA